MKSNHVDAVPSGGPAGRLRIAPQAVETQHQQRRERLLRLQGVCDATGLSRSTLYALMKEGKFCKPISLCGRSRAWIESQVQEWIAQQIEANRSGVGS